MYQCAFLSGGTNLFVGRVSYDVNPRLRVGTILTNGSPDGIRRNRFAGFDGVWRTSEFLGDKNFLVGAWSAFSAGCSTITNHRTSAIICACAGPFASSQAS